MVKKINMANKLLLFSILLVTIYLSDAQCPWHKKVISLQSSCICAYNLGRELSVQCDQVNISILMNALNTFARNNIVDLLYINNSTVGMLNDHIFINIRLNNLQLSNCKISKIANESFVGQEMVLKNLNLQDNLLEEVPIEAIRKLHVLNLLDLSKNRIAFIPDGAFRNLTNLSTLKLNENNVTLSARAFQGLQTSLKNLNLKATHQKQVPACLRGLKSLTFLDLSLNGIKELPGPGGIHTFEGLESLTALNLERNLIQNLGETSFVGVKKTLSSLSLLNNLLAEFPVGGIHSLRELRVLDIGFNLLNTLPESAFRGNPSITLMALDGNPLSTVPEKAFLHLNTTLRGLSLGGRFLHCDCKLRWVAEWIRSGDLQVTSREHNPQFCGSPKHFRDRGFYSIQPNELQCNDHHHDISKQNLSHRKTIKPTHSILIHSTDSIDTTFGPFTTHHNMHESTKLNIKTNLPATSRTSSLPISSSKNFVNVSPTLPTVHKSTVAADSNDSNANVNMRTNFKRISPLKESSHTNNERIKNVSMLSHPSQKGRRPDNFSGVQVKKAYRQDNSVIIHWTSDATNILGFRVVYRLFGDKSFKQGPPLESSEREFKIKNVPFQECIIVCVISLEDLQVTPETIPYQQCREVRTVSSQTLNMDKITIVAIAVICGTIIVALLVVIAANKRSHKLKSTQQKSPLPIGGLPVNCCRSRNSPAPLGSSAHLSAFNNHKDWDQHSTYSGRSLPRSRAPIENLNNRHNHFDGGGLVKAKNSRSIADGQSQHSYSKNSYHGYLRPNFPSNLVSSRPELQHSHQSLAAASDRLSRASYAGSIHYPPSLSSSIRRSCPRNNSREQLNITHVPQRNRIPGNRFSANSTHSLNKYCDAFDNWADQDMNIYVAKNTSNRNGLAPS